MNSNESVPAATGNGDRDKPAGCWPRWMKRSLPAGFLLLIAAILAVVFTTRVPADRMFRGKLESEWIADLNYSDEEQAKLWREFGTDGVGVLTRGLRRENKPYERHYRSFYRAAIRSLPARAVGLLPRPADLKPGPKMRIISLLSMMNEAGYSAAPEMLASLSDESAQVRQIAIGYFSGNERDSTPLTTLSPRQRELAYEQFLEALIQTRASGLRNNAAVALQFFPEKSDELVPPLLAAMQDKEKGARCSAAATLFQIAPGEASTQEVATILLALLNDPDDQIAYRAPPLLAQMTVEQGRIVEELIRHLKNESSLVATGAAQALGSFPTHADEILPALWEAHSDPVHHARTWGTGPSLKKLDPQGAAAAGIR